MTRILSFVLPVLLVPVVSHAEDRVQLLDRVEEFTGDRPVATGESYYLTGEPIYHFRGQSILLPPAGSATVHEVDGHEALSFHGTVRAQWGLERDHWVKDKKGQLFFLSHDRGAHGSRDIVNGQTAFQAWKVGSPPEALAGQQRAEFLTLSKKLDKAIKAELGE